MGYYNPKYLGKYVYDNLTKKKVMNFFNNTDNKYIDAYSEYDRAIANAVMWDEGVHDSINDAIDALR
jgi:hypothetical protein